MIALNEALDCNNIEELNDFASMYGFHYFWQKQLPTEIFTYDQMPAGFFDQYYGDDLDLKCPVAWAFRSRCWPVFSFEQARNDPRFSQLDTQRITQHLWESDSSKDGLLIMSGRPGLNSFAVFTSPHKIDDVQKSALPFIVITHKLDNWLKDITDLICIKREFSSLSPKEYETLKVQINYPQLSMKEQANMLEVSELTLAARHERIAKKFGVKRFIGAALLAERTGFFVNH